MRSTTFTNRITLVSTLAMAIAIGVGVVGHAFPAQQRPHIRLALVNVPDEILRPLLPVFRQEHGLEASIVYTGNDPFTEGRSGRADLVIAHYGHGSVEAFVSDRVGLWPKAVFANQMALFGPPTDPAGVRGVKDLAEALRRIESTKSRYIANASEGAVYLTEIAQGNRRPQSIESELQNAAAVRAASDRGAYVLWGGATVPATEETTVR